MKQLALALSLRDDATFENFYPGDNQPAVAVLEALVSKQTEIVLGKKESVVYLFGQTGVGCSHLLQAACHRADAEGLLSTYLPMEEVMYLSPELLENLEHIDLICIDNIDLIAGNSVWEEAIFHLYNRLRESETSLVVSGKLPLQETPIRLKDLISRLSWGFVFQVKGLTDDQKISALQQRAHARGFSLPVQVGQYLLRHYTRTMPELFALLDKLDSASLIAQRRITLPFLKEVLYS